jgi:biopolymer transport protein ExbD
MSFPRLEHKKGLMDLTPLIDVMFLLLLYFVLTMSSESASNIPINLSSMAGKKETNVPNYYSITITASNLIFAADQPIDVDKISEHLFSLKKNYEYILIRGDAKSDLGTILKVWDACKKSGLENIKIAVNKQN